MNLNHKANNFNYFFGLSSDNKSYPIVCLDSYEIAHFISQGADLVRIAILTPSLPTNNDPTTVDKYLDDEGRGIRGCDHLRYHSESGVPQPGCARHRYRH